MVVAETTRLVLREFESEDAAFILALLNSPSWLHNIGDRHVRTITEAQEYIDNRIRSSYAYNGFGFYGVLLKEQEQLIGLCGIVKRDELEEVDLGFAFLPEYEGKGYGFESATAVVQLSHIQFKIPRLIAVTLPNNDKSIRLLKKLGFEFERKTRLSSDGEELSVYGRRSEL